MIWSFADIVAQLAGILLSPVLPDNKNNNNACINA